MGLDIGPSMALESPDPRTKDKKMAPGEEGQKGGKARYLRPRLRR